MVFYILHDMIPPYHSLPNKTGPPQPKAEGFMKGEKRGGTSYIRIYYNNKGKNRKFKMQK